MRIFGQTNGSAATGNVNAVPLTHRLYILLPLMLISISLAPRDTLARGGTNLHEVASSSYAVARTNPRYQTKAARSSVIRIRARTSALGHQISATAKRIGRLAHRSAVGARADQHESR